MFGSLLIKECRLILKSITYYILCFCIIGFVLLQISEFDLSKPDPSDKRTTLTTDKVVMMQKTTERLREEYNLNEYSTYPIGFIKVVKLEGEDKDKISEIINEIDSGELNINNEESFNEFINKMNTVCEILGKGSYYEEEQIKKVRVKKSYEEALNDYNIILEEDHVSEAVARLFCDYTGIVCSIMPIFLAVSVVLRDKKAKSEEVIYSSKASAISIILARYLAVVIMLLIPVIIVAIFNESQCIYFANSQGIKLYYLSFVKAIFGWILPSIMVASAVGFFITELFKGVWAIFIQLAWWFISVFSNHNLIGGVGLNLVPRFNAVGDRDVYLSVFNELVINRVTYTVLSIILICFTIVIYNYRRSGRLKLNGKIFSNS